MEEDNKKERRLMKRTHNDAVRELVAFVRKRDKRLAAHQAEEAKRRMEKEEQDKLRWAELQRVASSAPLVPCAMSHHWFLFRF